MFGVVKLAEDVQRLRADVEGNDARVHRRIELLTAQVDQHDQTIELLRKQIRQLANATNCKITSPTEATPGGEVKKLTEDEIASRDRYNQLFNAQLFDFKTLYYNPFRGLSGSIVSDIGKWATTEKTSKKKKTPEKKK